MVVVVWSSKIEGIHVTVLESALFLDDDDDEEEEKKSAVPATYS